MSTRWDGKRLYNNWKKRARVFFGTQRITVSGLDHIPTTGGGILASNHLNWKDIFFIATVIPRHLHYVATYELFSISKCREMIYDYAIESLGNWVRAPMRVISDFLAKIIVPRVRSIGAIPVNRDNPNRELFLREAKESLKAGKLICIFPEGGTGLAGKLRRFKKGASRVVYELLAEGLYRIPVLPIGIKGTDKLFFPGRRLSLHIGKPLYIEEHLKDTEKDTLEFFTELLRQKVEELVRYA